MKRVILTGLLALVAAACASRTEVAELRAEVEQLKQTQAQLVKRLGGGQAAQQAPKRALPTSMDLTGVPSKGNVNARFAMVEFSDYECPFCIRHFTQTAPLIDQAYIRSGKIRYFFRDFPIAENHPQAIRAHVAAHCANEQGKYWLLHDKLFSAPGTHEPPLLTARAQEAGMNVAAFNACYASGKYTAPIQQSTQYAISIGGDGTPFFVLGTMDGNGTTFKPIRALSGAQPFAKFQEAIDSVLGGQ